MTQPITINVANSPADIAAVKQLFRDYADFLQEDVCLGDFEAEMAAFPDGYHALLLARVDG